VTDQPYLTADECVAYLRLDAGGGENPRERLRNLVRRQGLPVLKRGRLQLFSREAVDAWLRGERFGNKRTQPARLHAG